MNGNGQTETQRKKRPVYQLTREDRSKGGKTVTPLKRLALGANNLKHGKYAKNVKVRLCSTCQFKEYCHANDENGNNRCKLDINRFKNMLKIGRDFSLRSWAMSYIQILSSFQADMFDVCDMIERLDEMINIAQESMKDCRMDLERVKREKKDEKTIYKYNRLHIRSVENYRGFLRQKDQFLNRLYLLKKTMLEKIKEGKSMVIGDKVNIEQKVQIDAIVEEFKHTVDLMVEKYEIPEEIEE